ncbi:MAG: DUF2238 domain-containing protein [Verrucomicrobiaceae bacterium]|jgi:putative membrane protein|nr:DUF2238 domain-containing protein [Verrucomicrobiaceae bacterium]
MSYDRWARVWTAVFVVLWIVLGVNPWHRTDWVLENVLVLLSVPVLLALYRRHVLSRLSWGLVFVFMILHQIGAHYTYSEVPYDAWWRALTGRTWNEMMGWERNHFDRLAHFLYGLLLAYPVREIFLRVVRVRGFWGYFLPLDLTMSSSLLYELIEWLAAVVLGGDAGQAYLGTQGDVWDAHKDMALAALGALITMLVTALVNVRCQRDFARDWAESWRVEGGEG